MVTTKRSIAMNVKIGEISQLRLRAILFLCEELTAAMIVLKYSRQSGNVLSVRRFAYG
jgi:hypothetical protein